MAAWAAMNAQAIEYRLEPVLSFVQARMPGLLRRDHMVGMGWLRRGEMVAAVVFENYNQRNIWVHVAAIPGRLWLTRVSVRAPFLYAFKVCGVDRISGTIDASNADSCRFAEHLGFRVEATLAGAAEDGGDVLIYVLWRKDCRYVD
jgi:RimJ/RimL family protein N-acetyltransferase